MLSGLWSPVSLSSSLPFQSRVFFRRQPLIQTRIMCLKYWCRQFIRGEEAQGEDFGGLGIEVAGEVFRDVDDVDVGSLVAVGVDVRHFGAGIHAEDGEILGRDAGFLEEFPPGGLFRVLLKLHRAAGVAPFAVIRPLFEQKAAAVIFHKDGRARLQERTVSDDFS